MNRKTAKRFLLLHIAAVAAALLFPLYARFADFLSFGLPKCLLHDVFYVYCPLCGGAPDLTALKGKLRDTRVHWRCRHGAE